MNDSEEGTGDIKIADIPGIGFVVVDGNHRVTSSILSGEWSIQAQIARRSSGKWV